MEHHIAGNFHMCKFSHFLRHAGEHENNNLKNFYKRTLELEDGPPMLFQVLCGSPSCASFAARRTFDMFKKYQDTWSALLAYGLQSVQKASEQLDVFRGGGEH